MLVVNYNGNKPISNYYKYGVEGNNSTDLIRFILKKVQADNITLLDADYVYVKCQNDSGFVDKVPVEATDYGDFNIAVDWLLQKKHTTKESLEVSLCFEKGDNVWQTQLFTLKIMRGVVADDEIINNYPTIIQQLQKEVGEKSKLYIHEINTRSGTYYAIDNSPEPINYDNEYRLARAVKFYRADDKTCLYDFDNSMIFVFNSGEWVLCEELDEQSFISDNVSHY